MVLAMLLLVVSRSTFYHLRLTILYNKVSEQDLAIFSFTMKEN